MWVQGWRLGDRLLRVMRARSRLGVCHLAHPREACIAPRATHASHPSLTTAIMSQTGSYGAATSRRLYETVTSFPTHSVDFHSPCPTPKSSR